MSTSNLKNPWLTGSKQRQMLEDLDEHIMNGWASDATLGDLLNSLPDDLKDFFLKMKFSSPLESDTGFDLSFNIEE